MSEDTPPRTVLFTFTEEEVVKTLPNGGPCPLTGFERAVAIAQWLNELPIEERSIIVQVALEAAVIMDA